MMLGCLTAMESTRLKGSVTAKTEEGYTRVPEMPKESAIRKLEEIDAVMNETHHAAQEFLLRPGRKWRHVEEEMLHAMVGGLTAAGLTKTRRARVTDVQKIARRY